MPLKITSYHFITRKQAATKDVDLGPKPECLEFNIKLRLNRTLIVVSFIKISVQYVSKNEVHSYPA